MQGIPPEPETFWRLADYANAATVLGFAVTVVGFAVTIFGVFRSKSAAERAERAALDAKSTILLLDTVAVVAGVVAGFEDLKRLHRSASWPGMPERYAAQRRMLITVRAADVALSDDQMTIIQSAIQQLSAMEKQAEGHLLNALPPPDGARLNGILSKLGDNLATLLAELKFKR